MPACIVEFVEGFRQLGIRGRQVKKRLNLIVFVIWVAVYFLLVFPFANREVQAIIAVFGTTIVTRATKSYIDRGWPGLMFWKRKGAGA